MPFANRRKIEDDEGIAKKIHRRLSSLSKKLKYIASGQLALDISGIPYSEVGQDSPSGYPFLKTRKKKEESI